MRPLIFGTCYLRDENYARMLSAWLTLAFKQDAEVLIVDSASPKDLMARALVNAKIPSPLAPEIFDFGDNIGHPGWGRDGWGRAFCKGIEIAIERGYEWAVHIETDLFTRMNVCSAIDYIQSQSVTAASPWCPQVDAPETGFMFLHVPTLRDINFTQRYDWDAMMPMMQPEKRIQGIMTTAQMGLLGGRNDHHWMDKLLDTQLENLDYFTHADVTYAEAYAELPLC